MGEYSCTYITVTSEDELKKFKFGGNFEEGSADIAENELTLYKKSKTVNLMFGMIGNLAQSGGKFDFSLPRTDVASFTVNDNQYKLRLTNGKLFILNLPKKAKDVMKQFLDNQPKAKPQPAPQPKSQPQPKPQPAPKPQPQPQPTPQPAPKPQPQPERYAGGKNYSVPNKVKKTGSKSIIWINSLGSASIADVARTIKDYSECPVNVINNLLISAKTAPTEIMDVYEAESLIRKLNSFGCECAFTKHSAKTEEPQPQPASQPKAKTAPEATVSNPLNEEETIHCPKCGEETIKGAFCMNCGTIMNKFCIECGTPLPGKAKFCFKCGTKQE